MCPKWVCRLAVGTARSGGRRAGPGDRPGHAQAAPASLCPRRLPTDGFLLLALLLYAPVGLCLLVLRVFIGVHVFLVSCALPDSVVRRCVTSGCCGCWPRRAWVAQGCIWRELCLRDSLSSGALEVLPLPSPELAAASGGFGDLERMDQLCVLLRSSVGTYCFIPVPAPHQFLLQMCYFHLVVMAFVQPPEFPRPCLLDVSPSSVWGGRT